MITKYLIPIIALASFAGGSFFGTKVLDKKCPDLKCPEIPACSCPPAVEMQSFDLDKLNNKKGNFHLHNTINNPVIRIESKDSALVKQILGR